ncbi:MAG: RluA family pseudouridine synthase [Thermodesulfobacteriota bacterium]
MTAPTLDFFIPEWPVLYEDNHLLVLYKPAGLLVQGDSTGDPTLLDLGRCWLKIRHNKPGKVFLGMVHRLDRPVAGVVLFCRTSKAAGRISGQFREGVSVKQYTAVVEGVIPEDQGRLVNHLFRRGPTTHIADTPTRESREARLTFRVTGRQENRTLVEIDLETGRHHQIRAQFAHIGFPLAGDLRYGAPTPLPGRQIALLARQLTVTHPTLGHALSFTCPLPEGWPWPGDENRSDLPWNWSDIRDLVMGLLPPSVKDDRQGSPPGFLAT